MMIYKLIALAFILLTPIFTYILASFFRLKHYGILFTDLAFPLFALEIALISAKFFTNSLVPYYFICLSLLAISLTVGFLVKTHSFSYRRFFKFFWRAGFILTFLFYIVMIIFVFMT